MSYALSDIVESLKAARDRNGLTQRMFAEQTGTTQARVSKIENGETDPRISTIIEFARALDLELMLVPRQKKPARLCLIA
jgi:transcriptional regulator with XRE-family HTH domain